MWDAWNPIHALLVLGALILVCVIVMELIQGR